MKSKIEKMIQILKDSDKTEYQLLNMYEKLQSVELEYPELYQEAVALIEFQLRDRFPRAAKRVFGAKNSKVCDMLEGLLKDLSNKYDLSTNELGSHVKTGGHSIKGSYYLQNYISYRSAEKQKVEFLMEQHTLESELIIQVTRNTVFSKGADNMLQRMFNMSEWDQAVSLFNQQFEDVFVVWWPVAYSGQL